MKQQFIQKQKAPKKLSYNTITRNVKLMKKKKQKKKVSFLADKIKSKLKLATSSSFEDVAKQGNMMVGIIGGISSLLIITFIIIGIVGAKKGWFRPYRGPIFRPRFRRR